jgi:hypothetical protein
MLAMLHQRIGHGRKTGKVKEHTHSREFPAKATGTIIFYDEFRDNAMHGQIVACIPIPSTILLSAIYDRSNI